MSKALAEMLLREIDQHAGIGSFALMQRFVVRNGIQMEGAPLPKRFSRMTKGQCFKNCADLAISSPEYAYVEGYALPASEAIRFMPYSHAWLVDPKGNVIDPTWDEPEKCEYFGVKFDLWVLTEEVVRNGIYGLLDTGVGVNHPLIFKQDPPLLELFQQFKLEKSPI